MVHVLSFDTVPGHGAVTELLHAAVVVAASVILLDPIFQGLAISLMAGEVASVFLSRPTVPILCFMDKRYESAHRRPAAQESG